MVSSISFFIPPLVLVCVREKILKKQAAFEQRAFSYLVSVLALNWTVMMVAVYLFGQGGNTASNINNYGSFACKYIALSVVCALAEPYAERKALRLVRKLASCRVVNEFRKNIRICLKTIDIPKKPGSKAARALRVFGHALVQLCIFLLILFTYSFQWEQQTFGSIGMDEIIFTLNMPLAGADESFLKSYLAEALRPAAILFAAELVIMEGLLLRLYGKFHRKITLNYINIGKKIKKTLKLLPAYGRYMTLLLLVWLVALYSCADSALGLSDYLLNLFEKSAFIEQEYVSPQDVAITFPEQKRNLIYIFMESVESSLQDEQSGGLFAENYIPELTRLAQENISFSQSELIEGAAVAPASGWTMAGIVAESAGVPLKLASGFDNSMNQYEYFLPGALTLGDILEEAGYRNYFMCGSDLSFGGRKSYFTQHGSYEWFDYYTAIEEEKIAEDYKVWWGYEDEKLYEYAKEKLLLLAESEQPFNFTMLTVDTHFNDGYVCELCGDEYEEQYANVYACASKQVAAFVEWISQQSFYENTTIVICGDHCSMDTDFFGTYTYDKHLGESERKVYNVFINAAAEPAQEKNRRLTTLDMFPTTLAALGVDIEGDRLGLGVNLFSETQTLSEQYGYEYLFEELNKTSDFYNKKLLYP